MTELCKVMSDIGKECSRAEHYNDDYRSTLPHVAVEDGVIVQVWKDKDD